MASNRKHNIEIGLNFSADTSRAKIALDDLQRSMNNFASAMSKNTDFTMTEDIIKAQTELTKLGAILKTSINMETGKFDLSKFQKSLDQSGMTLKDLRKSFMTTGAEGRQAFASLANAIITAEAPAKSMGATLDKFAKSLKDTARWQLSSNIIHGFQGALQTAYHYAQDLNQSLNDIRIVTGYNVDYMQDFAVEANKAAKALSTTTNEYAKASLIYFQQGRVNLLW